MAGDGGNLVGFGDFQLFQRECHRFVLVIVNFFNRYSGRCRGSRCRTRLVGDFGVIIEQLGPLVALLAIRRQKFDLNLISQLLRVGIGVLTSQEYLGTKWVVALRDLIKE